MNTIFDKSTREELIHRINSLHENSKAQWGKMNAFQMVKHCTLWEEMVHHNKKYKRPFIGILFGKMFLKSEIKDGRPMRKNNPSIPELIITDVNGSMESEKTKWISLIKEYEQYSLPDFSFVHPFFGKMTREQIGYFAYKHNDHHLRQFNS